MGKAPSYVQKHLDSDESDFNFTISVDDMTDIIPLTLSPSSNRNSNAVNSIKLCAKTVRENRNKFKYFYYHFN